MTYQFTGNPFVDTGIFSILAHVGAKRGDVILDELTPEILAEAMGEGEDFGKWLAKANRQLNAFSSTCLNSSLVNSANNPFFNKHKQYGVLDDRDKGWKLYLETLEKLHKELLRTDVDNNSKPFCESCGDRPATEILDSVGRDFFPLAGSLGNDAQALPAASRAPRVCGLCLIAVQWLPLGAMIFGGKLACFQFTEAKLSQFVVEKIYRENKSLLDVTKVSEKTASYGAGKGATPVALLLLETMRKLHSDKKRENLPRGTSLNIWAFSNFGPDPFCEVIEINNPSLQFLWKVATEDKLIAELVEILRRENPKTPYLHLLTAVENKTDYFSFYPQFDKKGVKQASSASPKLFEIFQMQVLRREMSSLNTARRLADLLYQEFSDNEIQEIPAEKKKKLFEQILKENPRRAKDRQVRSDLRRQIAEFAENGKLTLDDYVQLFPATNFDGIVNLNQEKAQKIWRSEGAAVRSSNYGWDLVWFYLHYLNEKKTGFELPETIELIREELVMFTNPKIQEFARDVFNKTLEERGGKDTKRGLDFIKRNIVDGFSRGKIGLRDVRGWWARLAEKESAESKNREIERYTNEEWDFMCRNERGQNEISEMLFQFRIEIANLYRRTNKEAELKS